MKKQLIIIIMLMFVAEIKAQRISHIETTKSWYYIYDQDGKKIKTLSESIVGKVLFIFGETFTSQVGSWIYTWSNEGKKINTRSVR